MKRNTLKRWIGGILLPVLIVVLFPGLCLAQDGDFYFKEGTKLLKQAKLDQAVGTLTEAIHLSPDHVEAYNNRGLAYFEQKKYPQAKQDFFTALQLSPDDQEANNNLGILFCGQEDYDRALLYFQRAIESSGAPNSYDMVVYRNLSFVYMKKGMREKAVAAFEKARSIQDELVGELDLRPYAERSKNYTLTLEFTKAPHHENKEFVQHRDGDVSFFYDR